MADHTLTAFKGFDLDLQTLVSGYAALVFAPDTAPISWDMSPSKSFDLFAGGGGGDTRPTSGMLYPRGQG